MKLLIHILVVAITVYANMAGASDLFELVVGHEPTVEQIKHAIDNGVDVNKKLNEPESLSHNNSVLMEAVDINGTENLEIIKLLIEAGSDVNYKKTDSDYGNTALSIAVRVNKSFDITMLLIDSGADISITDRSGNLLLMSAMNENIEIMNYLITQKGFDVNDTDLGGMTALHTAVAYNSNPDAIDLLLKHGSNPERITSQGANLVMLAADTYEPEVLKRVISLISGSKYFDINAQDNDGYTALMYSSGLGSAVPREEFDMTNFNILLEQGADIFIENNEGESAFDIIYDHATAWGESFREVQLMQILKDKYLARSDKPSSKNPPLFHFTKQAVRENPELYPCKINNNDSYKKGVFIRLNSVGAYNAKEKSWPYSIKISCGRSSFFGRYVDQDIKLSYDEKSSKWKAERL